jgi:hypothetical protein
MLTALPFAFHAEFLPTLAIETVFKKNRISIQYDADYYFDFKFRNGIVKTCHLKRLIKFKSRLMRLDKFYVRILIA